MGHKVIKMIKLKDLLEVTKNTEPEPTMIKLVFSDDELGLKDIRKQNRILDILERNLKVNQKGFTLSVSDIMSGIKYYPQTDKIVGNYPKTIFVSPNYQKKTSQGSLLNLDKCRFKYELQKVSPSIDVKQKK